MYKTFSMIEYKAVGDSVHTTGRTVGADNNEGYNGRFIKGTASFGALILVSGI